MNLKYLRSLQLQVIIFLIMLVMRKRIAMVRQPFTVRNSSCGKVMFSQASVILPQGGGGACGGGGMRGWGSCFGAWQGICVARGMCGRSVCMAGGHAWQRGMHGMIDGHCSGRYASYWNPFLFSYEC